MAKQCNLHPYDVSECALRFCEATGTCQETPVEKRADKSRVYNRKASNASIHVGFREPEQCAIGEHADPRMLAERCRGFQEAYPNTHTMRIVCNGERFKFDMRTGERLAL